MAKAWHGMVAILYQACIKIKILLRTERFVKIEVDNSEGSFRGSGDKQKTYVSLSTNVTVFQENPSRQIHNSLVKN